MAWVRKDDAAALHPKFFRAGVAAYGFHDAMLGYCNRYLTDGFIPARDLNLVYPGTPPETVMELTEILVREGLLKVRSNGYQMHDYLHYQPSKKEVLRTRKLRLMAGRKGGESTREKYRAPRPSSYQGSLLGSRPDPTRPDPTQENKGTETLLGLAPQPHGPYREDAKEVLRFLNEKTGRSFTAHTPAGKPTSSLLLVESRLKDGATVQDCKGVIARKVREWSHKPDMVPYLRPLTLFRKSNFEQYLGERDAG